MYGFYQARNEDFTCHVTLNNSYPAHLHKQIEILYLLEGELISTIDGKSTILQPGSMSVCFPNHVHSTESKGETKAILIIFDSGFTKAFSYELSSQTPANPFISAADISESSRSCIDSMLRAYNDKKDIRISMGYMHVMLGELLPNLELSNTKSDGQQDTCRLILEYINNNFTDDLTLDSISKALNISKYYISHIFSDKIRSSFPSYLNRCRIDYARHLLRTTSDSITEIGFNAGFNSSRSFYRAFHEYYGISPREYRNDHFSGI